MDFTVLLAVLLVVTNTCNRKIQSDNQDHFDLILDLVAST